MQYEMTHSTQVRIICWLPSITQSLDAFPKGFRFVRADCLRHKKLQLEHTGDSHDAPPFLWIAWQVHELSYGDTDLKSALCGPQFDTRTRPPPAHCCL